MGLLKSSSVLLLEQAHYKRQTVQTEQGDQLLGRFY